MNHQNKISSNCTNNMNNKSSYRKSNKSNKKVDIRTFDVEKAIQKN